MTTERLVFARRFRMASVAAATSYYVLAIMILLVKDEKGLVAHLLMASAVAFFVFAFLALVSWFLRK